MEFSGNPRAGLCDEALAWMRLRKSCADAEKKRGAWFSPDEMMAHEISGTNAPEIFPFSFLGG